MIFLFTPYTIGQLEYLNMMFASQASYNIRALLPMMMISIMIRFYQGKKFSEQWAISGLFLVLLFVSGISSSIYGLISCVIPILVYAMIELLHNDKLTLQIFKTALIHFIIISFSLKITSVSSCSFLLISCGCNGPAQTKNPQPKPLNQNQLSFQYDTKNTLPNQQNLNQDQFLIK